MKAKDLEEALEMGMDWSLREGCVVLERTVHALLIVWDTSCLNIQSFAAYITIVLTMTNMMSSCCGFGHGVLAKFVFSVRCCPS